MRKCVCEYCGTSYDAETEHQCPTCGAPVNRSVIEEIAKIQEEKRKRQERLADDMLRRREEQTRQNTYLPKYQSSHYVRRKRKRAATSMLSGCLSSLFIILFTIAIGVVIYLFISGYFIKGRDNKSNVEPETSETQIVEETCIISDFRTTITQPNYTVTCDDVRSYDMAGYEKYMLPDDVSIIAFHIRVKNTSDEKILMSHCCVKYLDESGEETTASMHAPNDKERAKSFSSTWLASGHDSSGWIFVEIPDHVQKILISYGSNCVFEINDF